MIVRVKRTSLGRVTIKIPKKNTLKRVFTNLLVNHRINLLIVPRLHLLAVNLKVADPVAGINLLTVGLQDTIEAIEAAVEAEIAKLAVGGAVAVVLLAELARVVFVMVEVIILSPAVVATVITEAAVEVHQVEAEEEQAVVDEAVTEAEVTVVQKRGLVPSIAQNVDMVMHTEQPKILLHQKNHGSV
jgi:hypothetical protein